MKRFGKVNEATKHNGSYVTVFSVSKSRSRDSLGTMFWNVSVLGLNVSFYKLIFNDRSSLKYTDSKISVT